MMCKKHSSKRKQIKNSSTTFSWDHKSVIFGDKFHYCNDSKCEGISGCGCSDADMFQVIKRWNNKTLSYDTEYGFVSEL